MSYHEHGMGTCNWILDYKWCVECARDELVKMLKYGVKKLGGYGYWYPVASEPLPDEWRSELIKILGEEALREIAEDVERKRRRKECFGSFDPRSAKCWSCVASDRDLCRPLTESLRRLTALRPPALKPAPRPLPSRW